MKIVDFSAIINSSFLLFTIARNKCLKECLLLIPFEGVGSRFLQITCEDVFNGRDWPHFPSFATFNDSESGEPDGKPVYDTFGGLAGVRYPDAPARDHTTVLQEIRLLGQNSAPLIVTYLLQFVFIFTTTSLAGHLGTDELAAVALALMTANITGSAVYQGLITGLDTLCAQAYGAGRLDLVGLHVQRMACLLLLVTIPIGTVWMFSPQLLGIIVPQENLAHMAGHALRVLLLGAPGYALFEAGRRFVQAQGLFYDPLLVMFVAVPLNLFGNWLLVFQLGWGFTGAALALSVTRDALPLLLLAYVIMIKPSSLCCWGGFGKATFKDWGPMVKLSLPGIWMVVAEWFAFEILTMAASYLSATELAAQSIILTVCLVMAHITFSISIAASLRIGNLIGSNRLYSAKVATRAYCIAAVAVGLINGSSLLLLRQPIVELFTEDEAVIRIASRTVPVLAILQFFDSSTAVVNGLLKGLGQQGAGAWINLIVYYLIGLPLGLGLCFGPPNLKLSGLWTGVLTRSAFITLAEGAYCWSYDWRKAIEQARERQKGTPNTSKP